MWLDQKDFQMAFNNEYGAIFLNRAESALVLKLKKRFVPFEDFKKLVELTSPYFLSGVYEVFIFDKSDLRAFHQPSMEWYYLEWKKEMYEEAHLDKHIKIWPTERWFQVVIEAGRNKIREAHPDHISNKLVIHYVDNQEEALEKARELVGHS